MQHWETLAAASFATIALATATPAMAQERVLGDIVIVGENFCPRSTMSAEGQLLAIASNTALFSLYGTMYGGDGRTTFALPDLRGRFPMGQGKGPGLTDRRQGAKSGSESVTLLVSEMPSHNHPFFARSDGPTTGNPSNQQLADFGSTTPIYTNTGAPVMMNIQSVGTTGGNQPVQIMNPFQVLRFCVATQGIFPSRN